MAQLRETTVNGDLTVLGDIKIDRDGEIEKYSLYPVGSIYCSLEAKKNEELIEEVGGAEWLLVDKEFASFVGSDSFTSGTTDGSGKITSLCSSSKGSNGANRMSSLNIQYSRAGHSLTFQITGNTAQSWVYRTDRGMALIDLSLLGVYALPYTVVCAGSNAGTGSINPSTIVLELTDGAPEGREIKGTNYDSKGERYETTKKGESALVSLGVVRASYPEGWGANFAESKIACTFNFTIPHELMLEKACNKFYYKRIR